MRNLLRLLSLFIFLGCNLLGAEDVVLQWDSNIEADLAGYTVYRSETSGAGYVSLNAVLVTPIGAGTETFTDTSAEYGTTYYWVVTASNTSDLESSYSNEVSLFVTNPNPPNAPIGLRIQP